MELVKKQIHNSSKRREIFEQTLIKNCCVFKEKMPLSHYPFLSHIIVVMDSDIW